jgi:GTPase SAR1 family protein
MGWRDKSTSNKKQYDETQKIFTSVTDGLKSIYKQKIRPLEVHYSFGDAHSPLLKDSDIEAKPMVLLLGQYSTGKTTFIRTLLERDFPGMHIGPEPTTDRFMAVMWGPEDRTVPGNTAVMQEDKPFSALSRFGGGFLNKFQVSTVNAPLLEKITLIDTPGVLSGEKQRLGRSYDFPQIVEWFAERANVILLLFDAFKLDISDEFKSIMESLKGHEDKMRIILNKSDAITVQQLQRVYGALMWSLSRVFQTPEVVRVCMGSFKDSPLLCEDTRKLLEADMGDLLAELMALPRNGALRQLNDLLKRAKLARIHAIIVNTLKEQMPSVFGKESKQAELIAQLPTIYKQIQQKHGFHASDFPSVEKMREWLKIVDFAKFPKPDPRLMAQLDEALTTDIPRLMHQFPMEQARPAETLNPFMEDTDPNFWMHFDGIERGKYQGTFMGLAPENGKLSGRVLKKFFMDSGTPVPVLSKLWGLADIDKDGFLDADEFALAMHLLECVRTLNIQLPDILPPTLIPASKKSAL